MKAYFNSFSILSESELILLDNHVIEKNIKKGDFLIKEGKICNEIVFIESGILRSFYINNTGDEITYCFSFENQLMSAFSSFITNNPTEENIQAIVDTKLFVLKKKDIEVLYENSLAWQKIGLILTELQFVQLEERFVSFLKLSAKQRYENLLKNYSRLINQIPLKYLATYLGITPRHLSRIRKYDL
ncbi:Crp/Fnr family transcriptional regulator [Lacihabitans soyangensis]|uniref:Crp/Fnr family transcriptional regulator n=1 Tax=Lacihabitans soyangensis TaxID=869394 RepID=A0AAE3H7Y8_9BACT|nr:Crp/Fnr family transcriptional regulator [Lacihabitans soyangensis]MCP9765676.1 Crp/Fnr family transcriptional regulator [Lacihabitans soyangensis]